MGDSGIKNGPVHCQIHLADHNLLRDGETGWSSALALILRSGWPGCWLSLMPLGTSDIRGKWHASSSAVRWDNSPYHWGLLGRLNAVYSVNLELFSYHNMCFSILLPNVVPLGIFLWVAKLSPLLEENHELITEKKGHVCILSTCLRSSLGNAKKSIFFSFRGGQDFVLISGCRESDRIHAWRCLVWLWDCK